MPLFHFIIMSILFIVIHRLMYNVRTMMSLPLFIELSSCIISTVLELLAIDYMFQEKHIDTTFATSAGTLSIHMTMVFILCFYAEKYTNQSFEVVNTVYCDLLWYNLSKNQQIFIILAIRRSQQQFWLEALGIFNGSMEIFLKVIKSMDSIITALPLSITILSVFRSFDLQFPIS